jgi:hypothetical protein
VYVTDVTQTGNVCWYLHVVGELDSNMDKVLGYHENR